MARVIWLADALASIDAIRAYIGQFNMDAANDIARRLNAAGESLCDFPNRGRPAGDGFRELVSVPPYVLRYFVVDEVAYIASIRHGRQLR
ncbi:MAG: type II toxin-antitoxin system RelE/ParE family toxin [Sphingomonas sp.]|uniref:type II toxin-antitoxin system RelE/ParE family toxin n=1 Tax=Sphingomonas sp. TaxID=28214 RepID=UPI001ACAC9C7|nr:type II toxin-antitoxin system RelE/ParE family toxin [Sphingomonas sp.]MBN8807173.1 type II toxin-antitoxin system RelE/ParE family toxin [Sphingomonas sp.]